MNNLSVNRRCVFVFDKAWQRAAALYKLNEKLYSLCQGKAWSGNAPQHKRLQETFSTAPVSKSFGIILEVTKLIFDVTTFSALYLNSRLKYISQS